jgi:fructuronate reductase
MLQLGYKSITNKTDWEKAGIVLPEFDLQAMIAGTKENPAWVHFGAGNIFRGFIAALQQGLLDTGKAETGIVAVETYDFEIIDRMYDPYDNLSLLAVMNPDGSLENKVVASIGEALVGDPSRIDDWDRLQEIFRKPSLQMASFTITEKGYSLSGLSGEFFPEVAEDMENGPANPRNVISKIVSLAYTRFKCGELPIAFVSMDNCSKNGEKLHKAVIKIAEKWIQNDMLEEAFLSYLNNTEKVSFPWSMIDKITPRPSDEVKSKLNELGFGDTDIVCTAKNTYIAPFVNAEGPQYLVVEDCFPNGRMPLELAGVYFTDRDTVNKVETMKVTTCLNPLHTALAIYGCLLGYESIASEMKDPMLKKLVEKLGYDEGMPVVVNPGIIDPAKFIREVIEVRFANPYIPDTPQRIAMDTSQKLTVRYGETIKAYVRHTDLNPADLKYIPLVQAGWCRYMLGLDDNGQEMPLSPDPLMEEMQAYLEGIRLGDIESSKGKLKPVLSNRKIFGCDLYSVGLGEKVEAYFEELISGAGAVRETLRKYLG